MAGTHLGGKQAAAVNKLRYGKDYYSVIGSMGGKVSPSNFARNPELQRRATALAAKRFDLDDRW